MLARKLARLLPLALLLAGCGARIPPPASGPGGPAAPVAVERFLQLAAEGDYLQMAWVFGDAEGPVIHKWPLSEVEKRMYVLARVLQHDGFVVGSEAPVPGRIGSAVSFRVYLNRGRQNFQVPFVAVRGPEGRWFVENVDLEAVTNVVR